jgi:hypothetical protein
MKIRLFKLINDGKLNIFTLSVFDYILEINYFITDYYSNNISPYSRLIFTLWKENKPLRKKVFYPFRYQYKVGIDTLNKMKEEDKFRKY